MISDVEELEWNFKFNRPWKHFGINPFAGMSEKEIDTLLQETIDAMSELAKQAADAVKEARDVRLD